MIAVFDRKEVLQVDSGCISLPLATERPTDENVNNGYGLKVLRRFRTD